MWSMAGVVSARCRQVAESSPSSFSPRSCHHLSLPPPSLSPELRCHEAGEALQLRTLGPRTGFLHCPAR